MSVKRAVCGSGIVAGQWSRSVGKLWSDLLFPSTVPW